VSRATISELGMGVPSDTDIRIRGALSGGEGSVTTEGPGSGMVMVWREANGRHVNILEPAL